MRIFHHITACLLLAAFLPAQEQDRDREIPEVRHSPAARKARLQRTATELQRVVNASAAIENDCKRDSTTVRVMEASTISEFQACKLVLHTRKTTIFPASQREVEFTTYADLADLTTPVAVEAQSFASCQAKNGPIWKVTGNLAPGKKMRVTRVEKRPALEQAQPPTEISRRDITLFFTDSTAAKKAGRWLEATVKLCGGTEWPDEDDLP